MFSADGVVCAVLIVGWGWRFISLYTAEKSFSRHAARFISQVRSRVAVSVRAIRGARSMPLCRMGLAVWFVLAFSIIAGGNARENS